MNNHYTVAGLRRTGYKVRVNHYRYYGNKLLQKFEVQYGSQPNSRGGMTAIEITTPENWKLSGYAECSEKDAYNRKLGVKIALNRAMTTEFIRDGNLD